MSARAALYLAMVLPCLPGVAHARASKPAASQQAAPAAVEPQTQWYYAVDGRTVGPIDDEAFVDAYLLGRVTDATSVWWEGAQGWVPLANAPWFVELDRWYVRNGDKGLGPMTGAALRASLVQAKAKGKAIAKLEVRLEWSPWVPVAKAAPLNEQPAPAKWEPDTARAAAVAVTLASPVEATFSTPTSSTPTSTAPMPVRDTEPPTPAAGDSDALASAMRLRKAGLITLAVGAGLIVVGGGIAGGYTTGAVGARGLWVGVGFAAAGVLPTIAGMAMFSAGNRRARKFERLASLRFAPLAGRGNGGIVFAGRF